MNSKADPSSEGLNDQRAVQDFLSQQRRTGRETCNCPESPLVGLALSVDYVNNYNMTRLLWLDAITNNIISSDILGCLCHVVVDALSLKQAGLPPTSITVDQQLIYWSNRSEGRFYSLSKDVACFDRYKNASHVQVTGIRNIVAFGSHLQPYPELRCLIPEHTQLKPQMVERTSDSITLGLPEPQRPVDCGYTSFASVHYTVHYGIIGSDRTPETSECAVNIESCMKIETFRRIVRIDNLKPFTGYVFMLSQKNHYTELAGIKPKFGKPTGYHTAAGAPSPPEQVNAVVLSPHSLQVSWCPPKVINSQAISYEVLWRSDSSLEGVRHNGEKSLSQDDSNITSVVLDKLISGQEYVVWVRAYSQSSETYSESVAVNVNMFPEPENITLNQATAYMLNISWQTHIPDYGHELQYTDTSGEWLRALLHSNNSKEEIYVVENLRPLTVYNFRLKIVYGTDVEPYYWPPDNRFTFRTLGDKPSRPGPPIIQHLRGEVYQVTWEPSRDNGAPIELYWLEGKSIHENENNIAREKRGANFTSYNSFASTAVPDEWTLFYNGTDTYWIITDLNSKEKFKFRVRSRNSYGWSDYSRESSYFDLSTSSLLTDRQEVTLLLWILTPAAIVLTMFIFLCVFYKHEKEKKAGQIGSAVPIGRIVGTDVELATLRELPRRGNFIQNSNALYTGNDCVLTDISALPHLRRDQITLTKFLGSGAFGEVFEGKAKAHEDQAVETRVAIKTLRKGATEQEKAEFMKEAQLMSNFKHPHILQLLGVCLDNDPNFIIMELMEGGDLLSYLRSSRPVMSNETSLTLQDLLSMSVDVARGCCYLEEMHFVHRDLACRNCLVSSRDPATRVVKIGDFGLARDIYKNDYYRKEGEGLLPVRWMATESLVDGVFTSQSDVWAFGVLIWEIMSLGQQPYPARNNLEVLHYVRNGGRLGKPANSSPVMYELMLKCWSFNPDERPTFRYCHDVLEELRNNTTNAPLLTTSINGVQQKRVVSEREEPTTIGGVPKYLELIYEEESSGYEIPRSLEPEVNSSPEVSPEDEVSSLEKLLPHMKITGVTYDNVTTATL